MLFAFPVRGNKPARKKDPNIRTQSRVFIVRDGKPDMGGEKASFTRNCRRFSFFESIEQIRRDL